MTNSSTPFDYGAAMDADVQARANGQVAGTYGVTPAAGVDALRNGPVIGVPPAVAMKDPNTASQAQSAVNTAVLAGSPRTAQWVANTDPAHVAAVGPDLPAMAKTGDLLSTLFPQGGMTSFHDIATAFGSDWQNIQTQVQKHPGIAAGLGIWAPILAAGQLTATPLAAVQEPVARGLAQYGQIGYSTPLLPWEAPKLLLTPEARLQNARNVLNSLDFLAGGLIGGTGGAEARLGDLPEPALGGPPHIGPNGPVHTPEGFVADAEGSQVVFPNVRAAGKFSAQYGTADNAAYSYVDNGNGSFSLQQRPISPPVDGVPNPGVHPGVDSARAFVAEADEGAVASAQEDIAKNPVFTRSLQTMEAFLGQQVQGTVSVDPEKLAELAQQGHEPFPELRSEIQRALEDGTDVEVPTAHYLTATAGQTFAQDLNAATTFREGSVSTAEAKEGTTPIPTVTPPPTVSAPLDLTPAEQTRYTTIAEQSRAALEEVVRAQYLSPLGDAKALGLPSGMYDTYSNRIEEAVQNAVDKLHDRAYAQVLRERKPDWQAAVQLHSEEALKELHAQPNIDALRALKDLKIDRDIASLHPEYADLPASILKRGGIQPDEAADLTGHSSGESLLHDIATLNRAVRDSGAKNLGEYLKARAKAIGETRARDELGHDVSPESLHAAASELINAPEVTDFLTDELRQFAEAHDLPFQVGDLKAIAQSNFAARTVKFALNIRQYEKFIGRAWGKIEKALAKGDYPRAFVWRQKQILLSKELAEAHTFTKPFARDQVRFNRWAKKDLIKGVAPDWSAQLLGALKVANYPVRRAEGELLSDLGGVSLEKFLTTKAQSGVDLQYVPMPTRVVDGQSVVPTVRDMTVDEYRGVSDMLNSMAHQGRREQTVAKEDARIELDVATKRAVNQLEARGRAPITRQEQEHPNVAQMMDAARRSVDAWATRPEQLRRDLDNNDPNGVFNEIVTLPLQARKAYRDEGMKWVSKHTRDLQAKVGKVFPKWLKLKIDEPGFVDANGDRFFARKSDVVGAALHWANADNRAKLIAGLGKGVTEDAVSALLQRHMTPEAQTYVHGLQDMFAHFKSDMFAMYKRINGISPPDVGDHYYPITRDPRYLPTDYKNEMEFAGDGNYFRATPSNPHAKARTNAAHPLSLNLDLASRRIFQVVHDIAFREVLMDANKFLGSRNVQAAVSRHYGPEYAKGLTSWLQDIAADLSFNARDSQAVKDFLDWTNEGAIIDMIGYSLHTIALHAPTALVQSMQTVGVKPFLSALTDMLAKPHLWGEVWGESAEIRNRIMNSSEGARDAFLHMYGKQGWANALQMYSMYGVAMSDQFSAMPTYLAAKRIFLADPRTAGNAVALAEQQVRQAHGSAGVTEAPAALRSGQSVAGKFWKQANQFLTFWNHMYNRQREIGQNLGFAGNKRDFPAAMAGVFSCIIAVGTIHHEVEKAYGRKGNWAADVALTPFEGVPLVNFLPAIVDAKNHQLPTGALESLVTNLGLTTQDLEKLAQGRPVSQKWIQHLSTSVGFLLHLPGNQLGKTLSGLHDLHMRGATSPLQALKEIISGPPPQH